MHAAPLMQVDAAPPTDSRGATPAPSIPSSALLPSPAATEPDRCSPPVSSTRGFKDFFRKRQKSVGAGSLSVDVDCDGAGRLQSHSAACSPGERLSPRLPVAGATAAVPGGQGSEEVTPPPEAGPPTYGNYLTISGTGANVLRDLLRKKYRSSQQQQQRDSYAAGASGGGKKSSAPLTLFRFRKKSAREEPGVVTSGAVVAADADSSASARGIKELFRTRTKSGGSTRVRTFLDSFRQRSRTESYDDSLSGGGALDAITTPPKLHLKKNKKFKVTPARQGSSARGGAEDEGRRGDYAVGGGAWEGGTTDLVIGPDEYFRMCRIRASSDPKLETRYDARAAVESCRKSASPAFSPVPSGMSLEQARVVIWKDRRQGTRVFRIPKESEYDLDIGSDIGDIARVEDLAYAKFMKFHRCYDVMPASSKLVVFDIELKVKKAFFALVHNGVRSAPLWDSVAQDFVGMLTITDFIQILQKYYRSPEDHLDDLEEHKISMWREVLNECDRPMVSISPTDSLLDAVRSLCAHKVHRLLVVDGVSGNALHILTHKRILKFLHACMRELPQPAFMLRTLEDLSLGTYDNIATATPEMLIVQALNLFVERRISALPVVDPDGRIVNIYAKFDIFDLAAERSYTNLELTISEAAQNRREGEGFEAYHTCMKTQTLAEVVETVVQAEVHRLVVVDKEGRVIGMLSLSDILRFLILHPIEVQKQKVSEAREQQRLQEAAADAAAAAAAAAAAEEAAAAESVRALRAQLESTGRLLSINTNVADGADSPGEISPGQCDQMGVAERGEIFLDSRVGDEDEEDLSEYADSAELLEVGGGGGSGGADFIGGDTGTSLVT